MRLSNKFTLAYAILTFFVLSVSFFISFQSFKHTSVQSTVGKLSAVNEVIYKEIVAYGIDSFDSTAYSHSTIKLHNIGFVDKKLISNNKVYDESLLSNVRRIEVKSFYVYNNSFLEVSSYLKIMFAEDEYLTAIGMVFLWTFVFLITLAMVMGALVSMYLLDPFYKTLNNIHLFKIDKEIQFSFKDNSTFEFSQLNMFVAEMMQNATNEYKALKEFNENASHELQTPLAVIQSKVDLLLQSSLNFDQMKLLSDINDQIERLSSIKKSLTLLVHLEHFTPSAEILNLTEEVNLYLSEMEDILMFKNIRLNKKISHNVERIFDKQLFRILMNNLFSNAIKYSQGDFIEVELTDVSLKITNEGEAPDFDPNEYFIRFIKSSGKQFSSGIGLSIVKKIIDLHNASIVYEYKDGKHIISISF